MANYSQEDKQAFRNKDMRISRTAAFNNIVALRIAEVEVTKDITRLSLDSIVGEINSKVFDYLWSGAWENIEEPVETPKEETKKYKTKKKTTKKKDIVPDPTKEQVAILETVAERLNEPLEEIIVAVHKRYGKYPTNPASVDKIVSELKL